MPRPFKSSKIGDLEAEFRNRRSDRAFLEQLVVELSLRSTTWAARLRSEAEGALAELVGGVRHPEPRSAPTGSRPKVVQPRRNREEVPPSARLPRVVQRSQEAPNDAPDAILCSWTALEVLSPQSFVRPEDLVGAGYGSVVRLGSGLPWEGGGEKSRPGFQLYYQLVLGSVELAPALERLIGLYGEKRVERHGLRGEAALAVVLLDRRGRPVRDAAVSVSSFGWGLVRALQDRLEALGDWQVVEAFLCKQLDDRLRRHDADGEVLPLDASTINSSFNWLVQKLELPADLVKRPTFALRTYQNYREPEPPQGLLLNSFFLRDLATARARFEAGTAPANLRRYLGVLPPGERRDLLNDKAALALSVSPARFPPARWPGPRRHPLVLLQQAAVNLALGGLRDEGILAVNGPPGTGKTTLLRDVVAALVTERARAMAQCDDPGKAFRHTGQKLAAGSSWLHLYGLDPTLRGFEVLVASSNNKAVENVSAELPGLASVAEDAIALRYLKTLSDRLRDGQSWGLAAAVLGNAANRSRFRHAFWQDDDHGLRRYLAAAAGIPQVIEETDPVTGEVRSRQPRIVAAEQPPRDHDEALRRWKPARDAFWTALRRSEAMLREMEEVRRQAELLPSLVEAVQAAARAVEEQRKAADRLAVAAADAGRALATAQDAARITDAEFGRLQAERPGHLARLFRTARARSWALAADACRCRAQELRSAVAAKQADAIAARQHAERAQEARTVAEGGLHAARQEHSTVAAAVARARARIGAGAIDGEHFARGHAERHVAVPWLDGAMHRLRDEVFVSAVALHKAFLDAAAKPLRHNLGALMQVCGGQVLQDGKRELLPDLWASLFLVVPVVSTTFASVGRMLGDLPDRALGWLLIDEAGQAAPQAAVGALMRTRRAVVVGDPLQVEPVVALPESLTGAICRQFGADPDRFNAPVASVQTLADAATPFMAEFPGRDGSRTVGVPLLVHRRCAEPMFGIANAIAYEHLMVQAKAPKPSAISAVLAIGLDRRRGPGRGQVVPRGGRRCGVAAAAAGRGRSRARPIRGDALQGGPRTVADRRPRQRRARTVDS